MRNKPLDDITKKESSHNSAYKNGPYGQKEHIPREQMILDLIRRKIRGSVGKEWCKVREGLKKIVPKRLHQNIDSAILLGCVEKDNKVYAPIHQRWGFYGNHRHYVSQDGIIKRVKDGAKKKKRDSRKKIKWAIIDKRTFVKAGDFWEELFFYEWFPTITTWKSYDGKVHSAERGPFDIWFQRTISQQEAIEYWGAPIYCFKKLQCNKAEIRRINKSQSPTG